ncbi:MAG: PCMD domain-containing protein [Porphyromonadaceae bacterium]|nr:PCMD domain-containing protein [Porphyromonadaceae bacterium]
MKKIYTSLFTFLWLIAFTAYGQTYQLPDPGFETTFSGNSDEPVGFHSFNTGTGTFASTGKSTSYGDYLLQSTDTRPGSEGSYSCEILARKIIIAVANGNLTTGQIYAGSFTASDGSKNYNQSGPSSDYSLSFTGKPDSLTVWLKYIPAGSTSDDVARVNAVIHSDADYRDPEDSDPETYTAVKFSQATIEYEATDGWQRFSQPFTVYNEDLEPAYLLMSFTTNRTGGGGTKEDVVYIDDVEFIYNSQLASLTIDGEELPGFDKDIYSYTLISNDITLENISAVADGIGATVETSISGNTATITVKGNDYEVNPNNVHTYTINVMEALPETLSLTYGETFTFAGLEATYAITDETIATLEGEEITAIKVGTTTLTVTIDGTNTDIALTVEKAPLTITVANASRNYGESDPEFTFVYTGLVNGEDSSVLDGEPTAACEADETSMPGTYPITVEGFTDDCYEVTTVNGTLTIEKAPLTISVIDVTRKYGEEAELVTYEGLLEGDEIELQISCDGAASTAIPGEYEITLEGTPTDDRYEITVAVSTGTLTIEKADLTITISNHTITYGDAIPEMVTYDGLIEGDEIEMSTLFPVTETSVPGIYTFMILSVTDDARYNITETNDYGILYIVKASLTVTPDNQSRKYGEANPEFTFSCEGLINDDVLDLQPLCEATEASVPGVYEIYLENPTDDRYEITVTGTGTLTVEKATLTVTADNATREAGEENPEFTLSYEGFANNEEASVLDVAPVASCEADATSEAGTYAITVSGGEDDCYDFIYVDGVLTVTAPVSGVTAASADEVAVYLADRQLVVKGVNVDQVEFYTLSGQMAGSYAPGDIVTLPAGLYIVKAGKVARTLHIAR